MSYPKAFFYSDSQNGIVYRRQPTPTLKYDVNRMLKGLPCWIDDSSTSKEKKKKLILADWTCFSWSKYKVERIIKELTNLMKEGFKIYLWQAGEILYLESESRLSLLDNKEIRIKSFPHHLSTIIQVAGTINKIKADEILILDDYWMYYLLNQNEGLPKRCLSVYKVRKLKETELNIPDDYFTQLIAHSKPVLDTIIMDDYAHRGGKSTLKELQEQFPKAKVSLKRNKLYYDRFWQEELSGLHDVKYMIYSNPNPLDLVQFIKDFSPRARLKSLSINYSSIINVPTETPECLSELRELSFESYKISPETLISLGKILPHLRKINKFPLHINLAAIKGFLSYMKQVEIGQICIDKSWLENSTDILEYLKKFQVKSIKFNTLHKPIDIETNQVLSILNNFSKIIEEVDFDYFKIIKKSHASTPLSLSLPILKKLTMTAGLLDDRLLLILISAAPALQELELSSIDLSAFSFPVKLEQLKALKLGMTHITESTVLQNLIAKVPALEELSFADEIVEMKSLKPNENSRLKYLTLRKVNDYDFKLNLEDINTICEAFPNLKKLTLEGLCYSSSIDMAAADESKIMVRRPLKHLKEIYCITSNEPKTQNQHNILIILSHVAPNLEKLNLGLDKIIPSKLPTNLFPSLIELIISYQEDEHCSTEEIEAYFKAAPNIRYCDFSNISSIYGTFSTLTEGCLPNLKKCLFPNTLISRTNLEILYQAAPLLDRGSLEESLELILETDYLKEDIEMNDGNTDLSSLSEAEDIADTSYQSPTGCDLENIDADTRHKTIRFDVTNIFLPLNHHTVIHPSRYRLDVFQSTVTNPKHCTIDNAFFQKKEGDLQLTAKPFSTALANYEGTQELILKSDEWMALASISPMEQMIDYKASKDVEMYYSSRDNLYYIRQKPKSDGSYALRLKINIQFRLHVPSEQLCPENIHKMIEFFSSFTEGELNFNDEDLMYTGEDYLNAILAQKKGACRHRAFAFAHHYKDKLPIRIITNQCHAFVEVKANGNWIRCDLGGYPAYIQIKKPSPSTVEENKSLHRPLFKHFFNALQCGEKPVTMQLSLDDYFKKCVQVDDKKWLIECNDAHDVSAIHFRFLSYCQSQKHPLFYIHSPDDLVCQSDYMTQNTEGLGELHKGPGGALYNFLNHVKTQWKKGQPTPVLMINYVNFTNEDLACCNSLLDSKRHADGIDVPDDIMIIGLIDQFNRDTVPGPDFYSRFGSNKGPCPIASEELTHFIPPLPAKKTPDDTRPSYVINLYHAPDWEQRLLGQWCPTPDGGWIYQKGALQKALKESLNIEIQNGLWQNKEFCRFWQEALTLGYINRDQCSIELPRGLSVSQSEGYDWLSFKETCSFMKTLDLDLPSKVLNPHTINDFFTHNEVVHDRLTAVKGFIEQAQYEEDKILQVNLTRNVSHDVWAMLFAESKKYDVTLQIFVPSYTDFPFSLLNFEDAKAADFKFSNDKNKNKKKQKTQLIYSTEADTTLVKIKKENPHAITIDISECSISDLLFKVELKEERSFLFKKTPCALTTLLGQGKTVILKGHFSTDLQNELDPFLFERLKQKKTKGRLIILSEEKSIFPYLEEQRYLVSEEDKRKALGDIPEWLIPYLASEPLAKLKTRKDFIATHPDVSSDATYDGLTHLSASQKDPGDNLTPEHAISFQERRTKQVQDILSHSPYVFLTGLSGVGKTTFVTKVLHKTETSKLYYGESELLAWARDKSPDLIKYLFWDEDNLSSSDRTQFEGLYDNEHQGILIQGQYHRLTDKHKMIFAGNPLSIGGERRLASFFARHGQALVFDPIPSSVLYHDLLMPLFNGTIFTKNTRLIICSQLLKFYRFLCHNSHAELLISPRELQMIVLLTIAHCRKLKIDNNIEEVVTASYFGYHLSQTLVPCALLPDFQKTFYKSALPKAAVTELQDFYVTSSRIDPLNILDTFLSLREQRQNTTQFRHESQRAGGLGGVILEGAPGQGKSEMVIALLLTRGYTTYGHQKRYYHLPASMSSSKKEELLSIAFNEGAVVVIDEINCFPINEKLLNALLMGTTPEGHKAQYPGFMIIGTQNPITLAGRNNFSAAIYRRLLKIELPNYSRDEMLDIIVHQGILPQNANDLVSAHESIQESKPSFRDVLSIAKNYQKLLNSAINTVRIGDFSAIDRLIHSRHYSRIDLIHYYLNELDLNEVTDQEYEILVYLFVSSESSEQLQALFTEIQKDEAFIESLNFIIRKHQETKYDALKQARVFEENPSLATKYRQKLVTDVSATLIDPWFLNSTVKIKELMDETNMSFKQAWLYANYYDDIIRRMLQSYLHYPTLPLMLAPLLGCSHHDAKIICQVAKDKVKLPETHRYLDYAPQFFNSHQSLIRQQQRAQREGIFKDEESIRYFNH